jgi:predicted RNA-binding protein with PIN domain
MSTLRTHLLVDGSNVLHAWPETRSLLRRDREGAKALLLRRLAVLHDLLEWRVTVVFDGRGMDLVVQAVGDSADFACLHTPAGMTADDVIEQLVGRASNPGACLVATADQAERTTIEAAGAVWCRPEDLAGRIQDADTQSSRALARVKTENDNSWRRREGRP